MAAYQYIYVMKGLSKTYPGGRQVLNDIWLSFLPGAKIGVLGLNGAGKSTLLRIMAGEEREFSGEAWAAPAPSFPRAILGSYANISSLTAEIKSCVRV